MKVIVTGGAGMVGSHLVDALIGRGDSVTVLDNLSTGSAANLAHLADDPRLELLDLDITQPLPPNWVDTAVVDQIYHLASPASPVAYSRDPVATLLVNALGTRQLLELARANRARFLLASTSEVYGDPLVSPQAETYWGNVNPIGPRSCYDEGKRFAEALTIAYCREHGLDVRIARIFNAYGPRSAIDDGRVIPNYCVQAIRGKPLAIYGDGTQTRSFCYIDDLIRGLSRLMDTEGLSGEVVNLGSPEERTIAEVAEMIIDLAGSVSAIMKLPLRENDPIKRCPDISKAWALLNWEPQTDFQHGITKTLDAFRSVLSTR